jgi:hypothetical protein
MSAAATSSPFTGQKEPRLQPDQVKRPVRRHNLIDPSPAYPNQASR